MTEPEDILELDGVRVFGPARSERASGGQERGPRVKFLSVWFRCCNAYGRMYRNREATAYDGRCPRCGAAVRAAIGSGGTSQRAFVAE